MAKPKTKLALPKEIPPVVLQTPKGMHDILPAEFPFWEKFEREAKEIAEFYNFSPIETPILEHAELFIRGVGESTDIVQKEMFLLRTKGGTRLTLRPEMTAPIVRAFIQHGMHKLPQPQRLYYLGPAFRHENPQAGRFREMHQFGLEILSGEGEGDPIYDAEVIIATCRLFEELRIKNLTVQINSIGCRTCRTAYKKKLADYYKGAEVCRDCKKRLLTNPLRVLDCKSKICAPIKAGAPSILDFLCAACKNHFKQVLEFLDEVSLPYTLNPQLVRGLDYYNRTVFEVFSEGNELALAGGGRYDYLAEMLGGRPTPAVGVAVGIERVIELMRPIFESTLNHSGKAKVFLVYIGDAARLKSLSLIEELRKNRVMVAEALGKNSLSSQLDTARKMGAPLALIFGQKESHEGNIIIRDMLSGVQEVVPLSKVAEEVKRRLHAKD